MTPDDAFARLLERYLHEYQGSTPLAASVRDAVLTRVPSTMQHHATWWTTRRSSFTQSLAQALAATAAALVFAIVGIDLLSGRDRYIGSPAPGTDLGVFEPVRGRIVFRNGTQLQAVDPADPSSSLIVEPGDLGLGPWPMPAGWSADGSKLALTHEYDGQLYVMDRTGSLDRVPVEELADIGFGCCSFVTSNWLSPDGTRGLAATQWDVGSGGLYVLDLDDIDRSRIVKLGQFERAPGGILQPATPVWSPDGSQAAYVWSKGGDLRTPAVGIVDLANGSSHELVSGWGLVRQLAWSPDGSQLLVVAGPRAPTYGGSLNPLVNPQPTSLYLVDIDVGEPHELASGNYVAAAWSPDGGQIVAIDYPGRRQVVVMNADGSGDRRALAELDSADLFTGVVWHPILPEPSG